MPHSLEHKHKHTYTHTHTRTPPKHAGPTHAESGFILAFTHTKRTQISSSPPKDHFKHPVSSAPSSHPTPPARLPGWGLAYTSPRACSMKCPCSSPRLSKESSHSVQW